MFTKQTIRDIDIDGKRVLLRVDYNVPLEDGKVTDDYRIKQSLPTIKYLLNQKTTLILCSHAGRPTGPEDTALSLAPVAKRLAQLLDRPVEFVADATGDEAKQAAKALQPGGLLMLENLRFYSGEKANNDDFAKRLASYADVYVDDAFGVVHRVDASVVAITKHLPGAAGLLLEREVDTITSVMQAPEHPLMAIVGGAKIADKLDVLHRFIDIADIVAIGGAMSNTFLAAQGVAVGKSLYEKDQLKIAKDIMRKAAAEAKQRGFVFVLPHDVVVATAVSKTAPTRIVEVNAHTIADIQHYPKRPPHSAGQVHADEMILDIGPSSAAFIAGAVQLCKTVVWNGAMGVTETEGLQGPIGPTSHGTQTVVEALLGDFGRKPFTVVGGGDTVGYVESRNLVEQFDHVSTGGGASLELMAGRKLPGVEALQDKK